MLNPFDNNLLQAHSTLNLLAACFRNNQFRGFFGWARGECNLVERCFYCCFIYPQKLAVEPKRHIVIFELSVAKYSFSNLGSIKYRLWPTPLAV